MSENNQNEMKHEGCGCGGKGHGHGHGKGHGHGHGGGCCGGKGHGHKHEGEHACGHEHHEHAHGEGCGCGHHHDHEHEHHDHDIVTLGLEDGSELRCPVIDIFDLEDKTYIALLHPVEEFVLLYHFEDNEDGTIEINTILDDAEFERVSEKFRELHEMEGVEAE